MGSLRLPRLVPVISLSVCAMLLAASPARAQAEQPAPAHIAFVDGVASLDREGQTEPAVAGIPFVTGDRLRTEGGRVEILFPDGSALDIDQFASVDLLSATLLRVTAGRVLLIVAGSNNPSAAVRYQIDTPVASALTDGPGEFRVSLLSGSSGLETELAVLRGYASLSTERGSINVRAGERTLARDNESPMYPQVFNSARFDAFDRWAEARRFDRTGSTTATQYLPSDLRMYGSTFDRYGSWQHEPQYGNVWYPSVALDWRPYYDGYWSSIRPYGWTWIGLNSWAWPTHHYGRWGHARNRWFWIPGRRWGAAWVSWGAAPGYVSWCPLGFDNRPVFGFGVGGQSWAGWVVIPRTHFGGYRVSHWAVAPHRLHHNTPFATLASSPVPAPRTYAVPRPTVGAGSSAGTFAVPRRATEGTQLSVAASPSVVDRRQPVARSSQDPVNGTQAAVRNPRAMPIDRQPYTGAAPVLIDRSAPSAVARRPLADDRVPTPNAASPTIERSNPPTRRQPRGDASFRQPLPQASPLPESRPIPLTPPIYRRNPSAPTRDEVNEQPRQPSRQAIPRWGVPGEAVSQAPAPSQESGRQPAGIAAPSAPARSTPPRWEGYSRPPARSDAPPDAARPSAPPQRSPGMAVPRSGPPPSAAPSASPASPPPARANDGGSGGAARQRRPG